MKTTKKNLLTLPYRNHIGSNSVYDSLLFFSSNKKHNSGFSQIVIIGCAYEATKGFSTIIPIEIVTDISGDIALPIFSNIMKINTVHPTSPLRLDCLFPSGIFRLWIYKGKFIVGKTLSNIDIKLSAY